MTARSTPRLLTLHAVRLLGFAATPAVAARFGQEVDPVSTRLHEAGAAGLVTWSEFVDLSGWSLTVAGRAEDERLLGRELDELGARAVVESAHERFLPLNAVVTDALTRLQLSSASELDEASRDRLVEAADTWGAVEAEVVTRLPRLDGYRRRFLTALFRADDDPSWLAGTSVDSCHRVWMELHEDLVATLGLSR